MAADGGRGGGFGRGGAHRGARGEPALFGAAAAARPPPLAATPHRPWTASIFELLTDEMVTSIGTAVPISSVDE